MRELLRATPDLSLADIDTSSTPGFDDGKKEAEKALAEGAERLSEVQERLFASSKAGATRRVLLVIQAMDTAGKGGIVRHVVGAVDPQGVQLAAFKKPTDEELAHHFLWRVEKQLPA
ncbi:MAG: polyphosphate kinase 2 family protein, partial [Microcella sp.]|nr:polyphosphate kinase 2 family protein [Microcella sp.]